MSEFFPDSQPPTQFDKELAIIDAYADSPMAIVVQQNLDTLKRFAGIGIPLYKTNEDDAILEVAEDVGGGFVDLGSTAGLGEFSHLLLRPPSNKELSSDEYQQANDETRYNATKGRYGDFIAASELPEESETMLIRLRELIDAEEIRNEPGFILHKGVYQDVTVFIAQYKYNSTTFDGTFTTHNAMLLGERAGEDATEELSSSDIAKARDAGIDVFAMRSAGVKHSNLGHYIRMAKEIDLLGSAEDVDASKDEGSLAPTTDSTLGKMMIRNGFPFKRRKK